MSLQQEPGNEAKTTVLERGTRQENETKSQRACMIYIFLRDVKYSLSYSLLTFRGAGLLGSWAGRLGERAVLFILDVEQQIGLLLQCCAEADLGHLHVGEGERGTHLVKFCRYIEPAAQCVLAPTKLIELPLKTGFIRTA